MKLILTIPLFLFFLASNSQSKGLIIKGDTLMWLRSDNDTVRVTSLWSSDSALVKVPLGANTAMASTASYPTMTGVQNITNKTFGAGNTWNGNAIGDAYISSASAWNAKQSAITTGTTSQYFKGDLSLATFPTTTASFTNSTNKNFVTDAQLTVIGNTSGTNTGDQTISDATISTTDILTNNVSPSKHGFAPKGNNSSMSYLDGTGAYSTPSATTGSFTFLSGDVTNNNASANTIADVTGLSFAVTSGVTYKFKFFIVYTSAATTTGSRWSINGPATTFLNYRSTYTLTATSETINSGVAAYNSPSGASASSLASNNIAIIEGIIKPSANGTVIARFASEVSSSAIVAKANQSYVEFQVVN